MADEQTSQNPFSPEGSNLSTLVRQLSGRSRWLLGGMVKLPLTLVAPDASTTALILQSGGTLSTVDLIQMLDSSGGKRFGVARHSFGNYFIKSDGLGLTDTTTAGYLSSWGYADSIEGALTGWSPFIAMPAAGGSAMPIIMMRLSRNGRSTLEFWKDLDTVTPVYTKPSTGGMGIGLDVVGVAGLTNDLIFSSYGSGAWREAARLTQAGVLKLLTSGSNNAGFIRIATGGSGGDFELSSWGHMNGWIWGDGASPATGTQWLHADGQFNRIDLVLDVRLGTAGGSGVASLDTIAAGALYLGKTNATAIDFKNGKMVLKTTNILNVVEAIELGTNTTAPAAPALKSDGTSIYIEAATGQIHLRPQGVNSNVGSLVVGNGTIDRGDGGTWAIGGTNATLVRLGSGTALVDFNYAVTALGGGAAPTLGTIGGSGPATAAQHSWLKVKVNNVDSWIPLWR